MRPKALRTTNREDVNSSVANVLVDAINVAIEPGRNLSLDMEAIGSFRYESDHTDVFKSSHPILVTVTVLFRNPAQKLSFG
jgi:hypothetical protein